MTEFIVRYSWGKGIELGIAVPGFDGSKWPTANKYWFDLTFDEFEDLISKFLSLYKEEVGREFGVSPKERGEKNGL